MDDLGGRFRNPLVLSFILVWLCKHWELVYMLYNFNENLNLSDRIFQIKHYIGEQKFQGIFLIPLGLAFISLISFYLIGICAQAIKVLIGKRLTAALLAASDRGKYELKTVSDKNKRQNRELKILIGKLENDVSLFKENLSLKD